MRGMCRQISPPVVSGMAQSRITMWGSCRSNSSSVSRPLLAKTRLKFLPESECSTCLRKTLESSATRTVSATSPRFILSSVRARAQSLGCGFYGVCLNQYGSGPALGGSFGFGRGLRGFLAGFGRGLGGFFRGFGFGCCGGFGRFQGVGVVVAAPQFGRGGGEFDAEFVQAVGRHVAGPDHATADHDAIF